MANYYSTAARKLRAEKRRDDARFVSKREEAINDHCVTSAVTAYQSALAEILNAISSGSTAAKKIPPPDPVQLARDFKAMYLREGK